MEQRELRFRVWDGHTKSFFNTQDTHYLPELRVDENGILTIVPKDSTYQIQQYTGLKDKNGKEIYEGDIVRAESGSGSDRNGSYITYSGGVISIQFDGIYFGDLSYWANGHILSWTKNLEIIGNIYSNPELLTKELLSVHN